MADLSLVNALKTAFSALGAKTSDSNYAVGLFDKTTAEPKGIMGMSDLASVLGASGINLVVNDDLNNCRTLGWYFSGGGTQGSAVTPTLKHCPVSGGSFSMKVIKATNNSAYYMQILYSISDAQGGIYTRVIDSGGQEFKPWFKYTGTQLTE